MIAKDVNSKNFKDVVDYHYRFKIPDQFRRYQEKKREQAKRMLDVVEARRFQETVKLSGNEELGGSRHGTSSSGPKKVRNWSKTGGTDTIGEAEKRRVQAKDLLMEVRNKLGVDTYYEVTKYLRSFQKREADMWELKRGCVDLFKNSPELLERFMEFLPPKYRSSTSA